MLIKVENLTIQAETHKLIDKLSFNINEGDFISIVGENGCGKSSLVNALVGLRSYKGKIKTIGLKPNEIGFVSQSSKIERIFPATVNEIIETGFLNQKINKAEKARELGNIKRELSLEKISNQNFSNLSGGQKQKTLIARALAASSKLIILDEPTNNLDQKTKNKLIDLLIKLNQEKKLTIILVTHDGELANDISNHKIEFKNGEVNYV